MLEKAITQLLYLPLVSALTDRIYPDLIPEEEKEPAISYKVVNDKPVLTIDKTGFRQAYVQINCVAFDSEACAKIAEAVQDTLPAQRGDFANLQIENVIEESTIPNFIAGGKSTRIINFTIDYTK